MEDRRFGLPRIGRLQNVGAAKMRWLSVEPLLEDLGRFSLKGIGWVVVGGESGPGARPMEADWVRRIRRQCEEQGVPFFFKQWGGVFKSKKGREFDGRTWDDYPEAPRRTPAGRCLRLRLLEEMGGQ